MEPGARHWVGLLSEYLSILSTERGYSPHTIQAYESDVLEFLDFVEISGKSLAQFSRRDINQFLARLRGIGLSSTKSARPKNSTTSILRKASSIRGFYRWLQSRGILQENPLQLIDLPKRTKTLPKVLSVTDMEKMLGLPLTEREAVIIELLYACGLRVSELLGLRVKDLELSGGFLRCFGKGGKERMIPLADQSITLLARYIHKHGLAGEKYLLQRDNPPGAPMTRKDIWETVKGLGRQIGKEIHPHTFRHSFATHLLENGADLRVVQELLGHQDIATTQIYTQVSRKHLQSAHRKAFER